VNTRAPRLLEEAIQQIDTLADSLSRARQAALARPCPGRRKLGDGTVGAVATHTTDNYHRVAEFLRASRGTEARHPASPHGAGYGAEDVDLGDLLDRLETAKHALAVLAELDDEALDTVPPADDMKFTDGERTLEQIVASILKHQRHQVDALAAALA
jgi:hypothetical protein